jgi:NADP-dependent 3-hydroxy acid dehydrogenase YdfG
VQIRNGGGSHGKHSSLERQARGRIRRWGSIGSAVANEFAQEGAEVFLSGRNKPRVEAVAKEITANGGPAHSAAIDTLDDAAVNQHIDDIVRQVGKIDIVLDASGPLAQQYGNGKLAVDLPIDQFMVPLDTMVRSRFVTARAAARHMVRQRSGVIILVTGSPARPGARQTSRLWALSRGGTAGRSATRDAAVFRERRRT